MSLLQGAAWAGSSKRPPGDSNVQPGWSSTRLGEANYFTDKETESPESPWSLPALAATEGQSQDATTELNDSCELRTSRINRGVPHRWEENAREVKGNQPKDVEVTISNRKPTQGDC